MTTASELRKRGDKLFALRDPWVAMFQELAEQFYPERADFFGEPPWGMDFAQSLYDEGPVVMRRDLCNAVAGMLRPRGQKWFQPDVLDEDRRKAPGVAEWLDSRGQIMSRFMYEARAQFAPATKLTDHDFGTFGNGILSCEVNRLNNGLTFRNWHLRDCAWAVNVDGVVDTLHRKIRMTARQLVKRFPQAKLHADVLNAAETDPEHEFHCRAIMMPNADYQFVDKAAARRFRKMPFVSVYLDEEHNELLSEAGSWEFRYVVPRWQMVGDSPYAVSPATIDSLPGVRQLQAMARTGNEALERSINPPVKATEEAVRGDINLYAGGVTWVDKGYDEKTGPAMELFDVGKNAILALQSLDAQRTRLANSTYATKLNMPQVPKEMTAFEVQQRVEEYIREAMPVVEPWESNYNGPLLDEIFNTLLRVGALGPPDLIPPALRGQDIVWTFFNPLQAAQERVKTQMFTAALGVVTEASQLDPAARFDLDVREGTRDAIAGTGAPATWVRDRKAADQMADQSAQQAAASSLAENVGKTGASIGQLGTGLAAIRQATAA